MAKAGLEYSPVDQSSIGQVPDADDKSVDLADYRLEDLDTLDCRKA
jgi:hypothetical protein